MSARKPILTVVVVGVLLAAGVGAEAATYLPIPDERLAGRSPVIAFARVVSNEQALMTMGRKGPRVPHTVTTLEVIETLKGSVETSRIRLVLPGGRAGGQIWHVYGRPEFLPREEVIVFAFPLPGRPPDEYGLTEFGLSKFDVLEDTEGRLFAVRSEIQGGQERFLTRTGEQEPEPDSVRELTSFLAALRAFGQGQPLPAIARATPDGPIKPRFQRPSPLWANIGEGKENLWRWNWSGADGQTAQPSTIVSTSGTMSGLSDGSNGTAAVTNAVTQWSGVSASDVRVSTSTGSSPLEVSLGVDDSPLSCPIEGVLGVGGPSCSGGNCYTYTYDGVTNYLNITAGSVRMNMFTTDGSCTYDITTYTSAVLHEVGHALGLGHPDQACSSKDSTNCSGANTAVMRSVVTGATTPQSDDVLGIQYLYPATLAAPTNVTATAASSSSVSVTWTASAGATSYEVARSAGGGSYTTLGTTSSTSYTDSTASAATSYLYKVRAVAPSTSSYSTADLATTVIFTDSTLTAGTTTIKAAHFTELRTAVNAVRVLAGLSATSFTDTLTAGSTGVKALHLTELRTALDAARTALALTAVTYAPSTITAGTTTITRANITELRGGVS